MKQEKIKKITGKLIVKTGLHIGAGNDIVEIGGIDSPVIKNPLTGEPYIPGSSLKGKMRSILEWHFGKVKDFNGAPCKCGKSDCPICRVFGCANGEEKNTTRGPTRIIVRDANLSRESKILTTITEEKAENVIDRITAKAMPRFIERVVPGVKFDFEISYRIIDMGDGIKLDEDNFKNVVLKGLKLLQNDYLGGGGTRGNGQIEFTDLKDENGNPINL